MAEPRVLYMDDDPKKSAGLFRQAVRNLGVIDTTDDQDRVRFEAEVKKADLVVSDYMLDGSLSKSTGRREKFPEYPRDGQALNEVVCSLRRKDPPVVAIFSAKLDQTHDGKELADAPHLQAWRLNAAFVGDKNKPKEFEARLRSVVSALRRTHVLRGRGKPLKEADLGKLLALSKRVSWHDDAHRDLELSRLPLLERPKPEIGTVDVFNWLLRRVLPYPGLFMDMDHLAVALRLEPEVLARKFRDDPRALQKTPLDVARYKGILSDFYGPRWWTAGVDNVIWSATQGRRASREVLEEVVKKWLGKKTAMLTQPSPVLLTDEHGVSASKVADASEAVRIMPSGWPSKGPWPWVLINDVKSDPVLKAIAVPDDLRAVGIA